MVSVTLPPSTARDVFAGGIVQRAALAVDLARARGRSCRTDSCPSALLQPRLTRAVDGGQPEQLTRKRRPSDNSGWLSSSRYSPDNMHFVPPWRSPAISVRSCLRRFRAAAGA